MDPYMAGRPVDVEIVKSTTTEIDKLFSWYKFGAMLMFTSIFTKIVIVHIVLNKYHP
jgi:hypothetical protein